MTDLSWIVGTIITATLMLGGMQLTLWSFTGRGHQGASDMIRIADLERLTTGG